MRSMLVRGMQGGGTGRPGSPVKWSAACVLQSQAACHEQPGPADRLPCRPALQFMVKLTVVASLVFSYLMAILALATGAIPAGVSCHQRCTLRTCMHGCVSPTTRMPQRAAAQGRSAFRPAAHAHGRSSACCCRSCCWWWRC